MPFTKSASTILESGGAVVASDLDVDTTGISYDTSTDFVGIGTATPGVKLEVQDTTTSSANTGGALRLSANDGAPMGDSHRLGVIEFTGAEDSSNTQVVGARIEAITDAAWTNVENGCALYFYTTDGNAVQTNVLKIDSNKKSTFNGNVQVNGDIDLTGSLSFDGGDAVTSIDTDLSSVSGSDDTLASAKAIGAQLDTKSPVAGSSSIVTVGTIATGTWEGTAIANAYVADLPTSKVTSGTFADGRISSSSVTQHQASITGTGALNSGSITSGFGNIDVGSSTIDTTGAVGTGSITAAGDITATGGDLTLGTSADSADTTIKAADESGTDTAGKKLSIQGGLGTGNAAPGAVEISVGVPGGASGTSVQSASLAIKATAEGPSTYYGGTASLANDSGVGEIVIFGTEDGTDTLAAGRLMVLNSSGVWKYADADAEATTSNLLAIALGTAVSDGLLVKGYFKLNSYIEGSFAKGAPCYVSEAAGEVDFTRPSAAGDFVRVLGYGTDTTNVIMFDPSGTWIEL